MTFFGPDPLAAALSEATTRPPSSVGVNVTTTAVSMAADVANDAHCNSAINVDGGPSPAALGDDADDRGAGGNTSVVQVAVVSVISNAAKSALRAHSEGVNWPLNRALPKGAELFNGPLGDIMRQFGLVKTLRKTQMKFLSLLRRRRRLILPLLAVLYLNRATDIDP